MNRYAFLRSPLDTGSGDLLAFLASLHLLVDKDANEADGNFETTMVSQGIFGASANELDGGKKS